MINLDNSGLHHRRGTGGVGNILGLMGGVLLVWGVGGGSLYGQGACQRLCDPEFWQRAGEEEIVSLIRDGENFQGRDANGETALHHAARVVRDTDILALLVRAGIEVDQPDWLGMTPLHEAAQSGNDPAVRILLSVLEADPQSRDDLDMTPLHRVMIPAHRPAPLADGRAVVLPEPTRSGRREVITLLLEAGADINARSHAGRTPLELAVVSGVDADIVRYLFEAGADTSTSSAAGHSLLHLAVMHENNQEVVDLLAEIIPPSQTDRSGAVPLHYAVDPDDVPRLAGEDNTLINALDNHGLTALHYAVIRNDRSMLEALVARGAALDPPGRRGPAPLHLAAYYGRSDIVERLIELVTQEDTAAEPAAETGLAVVDGSGQNALHYAARRADSLVVMARLIAAGTPVDVRDRQDNTPLHFAVEHADSVRAVELLLAHDARLDVVNFRNETAVHLAARRADPTGSQIMALLTTAVRARGLASVLERVNQRGETVLHLAISDRALVETVAFLIAASVDNQDRESPLINARDQNGETPLYWATRLASPAVVALLLTAGADPNIANDRGWTPLRAAQARPGVCVSITESLIAGGADPRLLDHTGNPMCEQATSCCPSQAG